MGSVTRFGRRYRGQIETNARLEGAAILSAVVSDTEESFFALGETWRSIQERSRCDSAIDNWTWVKLWWEVYAKKDAGGSPYVVTIFDGELPVAIFPFFEKDRRSSILSPRRLRQMGYEGELDPASLTEEPLAIIAAGYEHQAAQFLEKELARELRRGRWDFASFRSYAPERSRHESGVRNGVAFVAKSKQGSGIASLPATWAALRSSLSKSMRDNLGYYPRLLTRENRAFQVDVHSDAEPVRVATRRLVELHRKRAHADATGRRDDHIPSDLQATMLEASLPELAAQGKATVATLTVDGVVVAAQAFLKSDRQLLVHYSGFDPDYSRYSPLLVVQAEVLRGAIESGVSEMNVLMGEAPWQKRWNAESKTYVRQCRMASLWPHSLLRCTAYALRRELASRDRRSRFGLCILTIRQGLAGTYGGVHEVHLGLARLAASPMTHHLMRAHR